MEPTRESIRDCVNQLSWLVIDKANGKSAPELELDIITSNLRSTAKRCSMFMASEAQNGYATARIYARNVMVADNVGAIPHEAAKEALCALRDCFSIAKVDFTPILLEAHYGAAGAPPFSDKLETRKRDLTVLRFPETKDARLAMSLVDSRKETFRFIMSVTDKIDRLLPESVKNALEQLMPESIKDLGRKATAVRKLQEQYKAIAAPNDNESTMAFFTGNSTDSSKDVIDVVAREVTETEPQPAISFRRP